jgi:dTDP-4-amino-4,6-dideoxygalactose transaminase
MNAAVDHGVELRRYFVPPCHVHKQFAGAPRGDMTVTDQLGDRVVSLPLWDEIDEESLERVVAVVTESVGVARGPLVTAVR